MLETAEMQHLVQRADEEEDVEQQQRLPIWKRWPGQVIRFGIVGILNTALDLLILNSLLWLFPTTDPWLVVLFNTLAYGMGAVNSFLLNKYWTFQQRQRATSSEVRRFVVTTLLGIACNDILIWFANQLFHPLITNGALWVNASKIVASAGTVLVSYLGMRLWVFVNPVQKKPMKSSFQAKAQGPGRPTRLLLSEKPARERAGSASGDGDRFHCGHNLSVVVPAHNEEQVIARTVSVILAALYEWGEEL